MGVKSLDPDVTVIGAGPAGLLAAKECAESGCHVIVYEEHKKVGEPDHCAGLLSSTGLKSLGLKLPKRVIQNQVSGARIYSPNGTIERGHREAFVVDRSAFDCWLAESAENSNVQIRTSTKVLGVKTGDSINHRLSLQSEGTTSDIQSKVVVNAEGFRCQISKMVGLPIVPKSSMYPAYQYEVRNAEIDDNIVEMYYGRHLSSGFFLWNIPLGDGRARIGLASEDRAKIRLDAAIKNHPTLKQKLKKASIERGHREAFVVDRSAFDCWLAESAENSNVQIRTSTKVL
ncbi:MAG: FAD-dependent oxidoreductase, partial [Candidatus Thorarchaeota archaeon]